MLAAQLSDDQIAIIGCAVVFGACLVMMVISQKVGDRVRGRTQSNRPKWFRSRWRRPRPNPNARRPEPLDPQGWNPVVLEWYDLSRRLKTQFASASEALTQRFPMTKLKLLAFGLAIWTVGYWCVKGPDPLARPS